MPVLGSDSTSTSSAMPQLLPRSVFTFSANTVVAG
ncbi:Uncharacterised protein [Mycobacteroides abscessus subsp. abscessus]|nr:Uncharacterised protein [Mycobacteroides abscessus subsp. abscessus]